MGILVTLPFCQANIWWFFPWATKSTAVLPKAVATRRSRAEGIPPLWIWPSTETLVSKPWAKLEICAATYWPRPHLADPILASGIFSTVTLWPLFKSSEQSVAPSATTTMANFLFQVSRSSFKWSQIPWMVYGISGIKITSAPPAIPEWRAKWPAVRPITSTIITRSWLAAVNVRRLIASTIVLTAVSKPIERSVKATSLSMVLGIPTKCQFPMVASSWMIFKLPSPPTAIRASKPKAS